MLEKEALIIEIETNLKTSGADLTAACKTYALAKAFEEEIVSIKRECGAKVLSEKCYYRDPEMSKLMGEETPQRVTDPDDICEIERKDWTEIFQKCYELYKERGIADPRGAEYCPEAEAHELRVKAENLLIDTFAAVCPSFFTGDDIQRIKRHLLHRQKFIEIAMGIGLATEKEETI